VTGDADAERFFNGSYPIYLKFVDSAVVIKSVGSGYTFPAQVTYKGIVGNVFQTISEYGVIKGANLIELQADMLQIEAMARKGSEQFTTNFVDASSAGSNGFKITMSGGFVGIEV